MVIARGFDVSVYEQAPELGEAFRVGDDGRPGVEDMAVPLPDVSAAAGGVEFLQNGYSVAFDAEPDGRGQATKAAANHHRMRPVIRRNLAR